jgi:hypothetical protein
MAQVLVGGISFVDCVHQSKDGFNDVPMSTVMGDSIEKQMHDILVQQVEKLTLNTTRASLGKILRQGYYHNYVGFLLKDSKHVVQVNQDVVKAKMAYLHDHTVIASFIEKKPSFNAFNVWLVFLNQKMGGKVLFNCSLGKGFFMLKLNGPIMVKKLLMLTPFKTC